MSTEPDPILPIGYALPMGVPADTWHPITTTTTEED